MKTPEEIFKFAEKAYRNLLRSYGEKQKVISDLVDGDGQVKFPLCISAGKVNPEEILSDNRAFNTLIAGSKENTKKGYKILFKTYQTHKFGAQTLPDTIVFETKEDLLEFLNRNDEFAAFNEDCDFIIGTLPQLQDWISHNTTYVISEHGNWKDLLLVCSYFLSNPKPGLYIRELSIEVHTKFIEEKQPVLRKLLDYLIPDYINSAATDFASRYNLKTREEQIRFRILDSSIADKYYSGVNDLSIPLSQFKRLNLPDCTHVIILENLTCFLTLPAIPGTIAVFGKGFGIGSLRTAEWLKTKNIIYWGDLDIQGFQILSLLRSIHPRVQSVLMDRETFSLFQKFAAIGTDSNIQSLTNLSEEENLTLEMLISLTPKNRLEQERIPFYYSCTKIQEAFFLI